MDRHAAPAEMERQIDALLSKINAMEVVASGEFERNTAKVLRALAEGQAHSLREFGHLKKAIDLLTQQLFDLQNEVRR